MRWSAWVLLLVAVVGGLAHAQQPGGLEAARRMALETAAQNYLRLCVTALSELEISGELGESWEGKSCADSALGLPVFNPEAPAVRSSSVSLRPGTPEGFAVTVESVNGQTYRWPEDPSPAIAPVIWRLLGLAALGLCLTLYVWALHGFVFRLSSVPVLGPGLAALGLLAGGLEAVSLPLLWAAWESELVVIPALLGLGLGGGLLVALPRLMYWWGHEPWWISVGLSLVACWALLSVGYAALAVASLVGPGFIPSLPYWAAGVLGAAYLAALVLAWLRRRSGSEPPD